MCVIIPTVVWASALARCDSLHKLYRLHPSASLSCNDPKAWTVQCSPRAILDFSDRWIQSKKNTKMTWLTGQPPGVYEFHAAWHKVLTSDEERYAANDQENCETIAINRWSRDPRPRQNSKRQNNWWGLWCQILRSENRSEVNSPFSIVCFVLLIICCVDYSLEKYAPSNYMPTFILRLEFFNWKWFFDWRSCLCSLRSMFLQKQIPSNYGNAVFWTSWGDIRVGTLCSNSESAEPESVIACTNGCIKIPFNGGIINKLDLNGCTE